MQFHQFPRMKTATSAHLLDRAQKSSTAAYPFPRARKPIIWSLHPVPEEFATSQSDDGEE